MHKKLDNKDIQTNPKLILISSFKLLFLGLVGIIVFALISFKFKSFFQFFPSPNNAQIAQTQNNIKNPMFKAETFPTTVPTLDPVIINKEKEEIKNLINEIYTKVKNNKINEISSYFSMDISQMASLSSLSYLPLLDSYNKNKNIVENISIEDIQILSTNEAKGRVKITVSNQEILIGINVEKMSNKWKISGIDY